MVIWIIGKSGSGKTFLSKRLYKKFREKNKKVVWIDGDKFRKKFSKDLGFSFSDRKNNSKRIQTHCKTFDKMGYIVICSIQKEYKNFVKN